MQPDKRNSFPSSIRLSDLQARQIRDELIGQQSFGGAAVGGLAGAIAGLLLYLAAWASPVIVYVLFFAPGAIAGYAAKFTGRAFELRYRVVTGLVTLICVWAAAWYLGGTWTSLFLALPNALIAIALSRRQLGKEQEYAIYKYRMGLD